MEEDGYGYNWDETNIEDFLPIPENKPQQAPTLKSDGYSYKGGFSNMPRYNLHKQVDEFAKYSSDYEYNENENEEEEEHSEFEDECEDEYEYENEEEEFSDSDFEND